MTKQTPETEEPEKSQETEQWQAIEANFQEETVGAFSVDDIKALEYETGLTSETDPDDEEESVAEETSAVAEAKSQDMEERVSKDLFYSFLTGGLNFGNKLLTKNDPLGPRKCLDLKQYGDIGRKASDQIFDRLCDIPFVRRLLMNGRLRELSEKWGDVIMLFVLMRAQYEEESKSREKAMQVILAAKKVQEKQAGEASNENTKASEAAA